MPTADVLELLFATVATIVATLTGIIGAFSTFRLQTISSEIGFLKGFMLEKKDSTGKTLNEYIKGDEYHLLEKVYNRTMNAVDLLAEVIQQNRLHEALNEFRFDLQNIRTNQQRYDAIKRLTSSVFMRSLLFVFLSLLLLLFTIEILALRYVWFVILSYFLLTGLVLWQFVRQVNQLMD
ncbi:hypothetical protein [Spirosoma endophyticum]|uniref:Uncharacterized protein n=1 Tax=Spirosoma endophyticum TaxID=662367 RepID=A0A1I1HHR2_9BACT|nr:hypothetical protein [Spirosoma endophyticum]SFC23112.1 hypothetical protein SAMN05216167_101699 [Spirosoma endophyticum]